MKATRDPERLRIGQRLREMRERLPGGESDQETFAASVGMDGSHLSLVENGQRPLAAEALVRIARRLGVRPEEILNGPGIEPALHAFDRAKTFLQQALTLGVEALYPDRDAALTAMTPIIRTMYAPEISITSSSLKGLEDSSGNAFEGVLKDLLKRRGGTVRLLMGHPLWSADREALEQRLEGSIQREIFEGIQQRAVQKFGILPGNIRLQKSAPTCFSIFIADSSTGIGLINPYPVMRQAFKSFSLIVKRGPNPTVYSTYFTANFKAPFEDDTGKITVSLEEGIDECLARAAKGNLPLLRQQAESLRHFLIPFRKQSGGGKRRIRMGRGPKHTADNAVSGRALNRIGGTSDGKAQSAILKHE